MARPRLKNTPGAAGADEAGRGPLAGPVVAAAVILPDRFRLPGLNDSKQVAPKRREELAELIKAKAHYAIEIIEVEEVDRLNILWASMEGMARAVARLGRTPTTVYIDGDKVPREFAFPVEPVIGGDGKLACIAAASILAKTTRDQLMCDYAATYPEYGFERHFGYSTPEHFQALRKFGPCPLHRRTFAPVRELLDQPCLALEV